MLTWAGHSDTQALHPRHRLQRLVQAVVGEPRRQAPLESGAQDRRPPARRVALVAEGLEAGAHRPRVRAARAVVVACLAGASQAALGGEAERRPPRAPRRRGRHAQALVERLGIGQHARVEQTVGVDQRLEAANAAIVSGGYMRGSSSLRSRPSPCSPDNDPPFWATRSATSSAMRRSMATAPVRRRSIIGRMCRHPTLACPYQTALTSSRASTARTSRAKPASRVGRHRRVLDEGHRTRIALFAGAGRPQGARDARAAHGPDRRLLGRVAHHPRRRRLPRSRRSTSSGSPLCSTSSSASASPAKPSSARTAGGRLAGSSRARSISSIADGPASEQPDHRLQGGVHRVEADQRQAPARRPLHQAQLRAAGQRPACPPSRTAAAASRAPRPGQRVERVPRHAADQLRRPRVRGEGAGRSRARRRGRPAPQRGARPVGQGHVEREHVVRPSARGPPSGRRPSCWRSSRPSVARLAVATSAPKASPWARGGGVEVRPAPRRGRRAPCARRGRSRSTRAPSS